MSQLILFLLTSAFLFSIGVYLVLAKNNFIFILIGIELMLNAANLNLIVFSKFNPQLQGQIFVLFNLLIAACETALVLAIIINVNKYYQSISTEKITSLKG
ncbi:MAG: NADH-quinone oxidoreductase subunit NuoK [Bacteroidota bacterium]|nr:NADH-quinone oxidoreductase subunit NuoK [Bacteroidota bacterium]